MELSERAICYLQEHGATEPARLAAHVFGGEGFATMLPAIATDRMQFDGCCWSLRQAEDGLAFLHVLTTGPNVTRHRIVELATLCHGHEFHAFVESGRPIPVVLRRLGVPEHPDGLRFDEVRDAVQQFVGGKSVVCYDASPPFLAQLLGPVWATIDVLRLVFQLTYFAGRPDPSQVAKYFGLKPPINRRPLAMADFTRRLFKRICDGHSTEELIRLGAPRLPSVVSPAASSGVPGLNSGLPAEDSGRPQPGVYVLRANDGSPLYVGKSKFLQRRVNSYFGQAIAESRNLYHLVQMTERVELIPIDGETEALLLESELIQRWLPPYNIQRRHHYAGSFLCLTVGEPFPRLSVARQPEADGAIYFGPFRHPTAAARMHALLAELLRLRTCTRHLPARRRPKPPCELAASGRCLVPCIPGPPVASYDAEVALAQELLTADAETFRRRLLQLLRQRPPTPERVRVVRRRLRALSSKFRYA